MKNAVAVNIFCDRLLISRYWGLIFLFPFHLIIFFIYFRFSGISYSPQYGLVLSKQLGRFISCGLYCVCIRHVVFIWPDSASKCKNTHKHPGFFFSAGQKESTIDRWVLVFGCETISVAFAITVSIARSILDKSQMLFIFHILCLFL